MWAQGAINNERFRTEAQCSLVDPNPSLRDNNDLRSWRGEGDDTAAVAEEAVIAARNQ